jgi:hypothetical protein
MIKNPLIDRSCYSFLQRYLAKICFDSNLAFYDIDQFIAEHFFSQNPVNQQLWLKRKV